MNNDFFNFCIQQPKAGQRVLDKPTFYRDFILDPQLNGPGALGQELPSMTRIGPDISFTRTSSATFINQEGNIQVVDSNVPRFEWENHRTNLLSASNNFSSSSWVGYWNKSPDWRQDAIGPDGVPNSAWSLPLSSCIFGPGSNITGLIQENLRFLPLSVRPLSGLPITSSIWARADDTSYQFISFGIEDSQSGNINVTTTWRRFTHTGISRLNRGLQIYAVSGINTNPNSKIYLYGAQVEIGSTATPYISTGNIPVTVSQPKGLLIEEQRVNSVGEQNLFNWGNFDGVSPLSAGSGIAGLSSFIINDSSNTNFHQRNYIFPTALLSSTTYTFSCYIKKNPTFNNFLPTLRVNLQETGFAGINFNQATGEASNATYSTRTSAVSVQDFGTFFRTFFTFNSQSTAAPTTIDLIPSHGPVGSISSAFSGTSIEVAGIQVEQGAFPTSYIPTFGSQATRRSDLATLSGGSFTTIYNNKEGTLYTEARSPSASITFIPYSMSKTGTTNEIRIGSTSTGGNFQFIVVNSSTQCSLTPISPILAGTPYSFAAAYKANNFAASVNNSTVATDNIGTIPEINQLTIGRRGIGTASTHNGHIRKIGYWPKRLSNTALRALASPSLALGKYFAEENSLYIGPGPGVEVTRTSSATYFASGGKLTTAFYNRPRFDYDPVTNVSRGLLIEEQRTNLLESSEAFDTGYWGKIDATAIANTASAPNGTSSANIIYPNISTSVACIWQYKPISTGVSKTYTATAFFKAAGKTFAFIQVNTVRNDFTTNYAFAFSVNLTNGSVGTQQILGGTPPTDTLATVTSIGSGWYRLAVSFTTADNIALYIGPSDTANSRSITVNGTDGILMWGAQLEEGAFATSYIPTTIAQVTRTADTVQINPTNWQRIYNPEQGTFYTKVLPLSGSQAAAVIDVGDSFNSIHGIWKSGPGGDGSSGTSWNAFSFSDFLSGGGQLTPLTANFVSTAGVANSSSGIAYTYGFNNFNASVNGSLSTIITQSTAVSAIPVMTRFNHLNGHVQTLEYYSVQLTNAQLTALTMQ